MEKEKAHSYEDLDVKPPYVCTIKIGGYSVNIFSDFRDYLPLFENTDTSYVKDIPGWGVDSKPKDLNIPSICYYSDKKTQFKYIQDSQVLKITGNPADFADGQAFAYIGFWMTEALRQKESTFTLHASSVAIDGKGVLLIGDGGSGKTAIALGISKKYDSEFISNDLSIVKHYKDSKAAFLLESSKIVRLRLTTVKLNFPELLDMFNGCSQSAWTTKIPVNLDILRLKTTSEPRLLNTAISVHLDSNPNEPVAFKKVSNIETQFALYENLSRIVRGSAISVFGKDNNILGYMPSLDTQELHQNRVDFINHLVKNVGIWNVSGGDLNQICEIINDINKS